MDSIHVMEGLVQIAYYFDSTTVQIDRAVLESAGFRPKSSSRILGGKGRHKGG